MRRLIRQPSQPSLPTPEDANFVIDKISANLKNYVKIAPIEGER